MGNFFVVGTWDINDAAEAISGSGTGSDYSCDELHTHTFVKDTTVEGNITERITPCRYALAAELLEEL